MKTCVLSRWSMNCRWDNEYSETCWLYWEYDCEVWYQLFWAHTLYFKINPPSLEPRKKSGMQTKYGPQIFYWASLVLPNGWVGCLYLKIETLLTEVCISRFLKYLKLWKHLISISMWSQLAGAGSKGHTSFAYYFRGLSPLWRFSLPCWPYGVRVFSVSGRRMAYVEAALHSWGWYLEHI